MNWQKQAIEDLRMYPARKESLKNLRERIGALEYKLRAIRSASADSEPVMGGASHYEDRILDNLVEKERLSYTYKAEAKLVAIVERALTALPEEERVILDKFFIYRKAGHVEALMEALRIEKTHVYRLKERALYNFTVRCYGLIDY